MQPSAISATTPARQAFLRLRPLIPGIALAGAVAAAATIAAPLVAMGFPIPTMVIALMIGIALHTVAARLIFQPGLTFCVKKLLRWAVALLGLRVALGDIIALGAGTAVIVVAGMTLTILAGFTLARAFGKSAGFGALAGVATAVCGASATLATSTVVPSYPGKEADIAFVVVAVNGLSTVAMVVYPMLCIALGLDPHFSGILLGATIHDVAQVVGAGYAVSEVTGNTAVLVKLFRVFLLLPAVLAIGWWFARNGSEDGRAKVPVPVFALVFLGLCFLNSVVPFVPAAAPVYAPVKAVLVELSNGGLLIAISALGLGTSLASIAAVGWRHVATVTGTTFVILVVTTAGLLLLR